MKYCIKYTLSTEDSNSSLLNLYKALLCIFTETTKHNVLFNQPKVNQRSTKGQSMDNLCYEILHTRYLLKIAIIHYAQFVCRLISLSTLYGHNAIKYYMQQIHAIYWRQQLFMRYCSTMSMIDLTCSHNNKTQVLSNPYMLSKLSI